VKFNDKLRTAVAALAFGAGLLGVAVGGGAGSAVAAPEAPFTDCAYQCYSYCQNLEGHWPSPYDCCMTACERVTCPSSSY
jgi:hypothetical protein